MDEPKDGPLAPEGFDPIGQELLMKRVRKAIEHGTPFVFITKLPCEVHRQRFEVTYVGAGPVEEMLQEASRLKTWVKQVAHFYRRRDQ